jgi:hypothetical protein
MPTFRHGKNAIVLAKQYNLSPYLTTITASNAVETPETTTFSSDDRSYITGHTEGTVSFEGLFDGTTDGVTVGATEDGIDKILSDALGSSTNTVMTVSGDGGAFGRRAILLDAISTTYEVTSPLTDVVAISGGANANDGLEYGVWLTYNTAYTTTTNGTAVDNAASSANGSVANLHVTTNTRSTAVSVKVQHSTDNSAWVDLITFTSVSSSTLTSERKTTTGTVNRYTRVLITPTAGTGSITLSVAFSRR